MVMMLGKEKVGGFKSYSGSKSAGLGDVMDKRGRFGTSPSLSRYDAGTICLETTEKS